MNESMCIYMFMNQPKLTTSNTLTISSQSTTSVQATKLNISLESNSLPKKRKAVGQMLSANHVNKEYYVRQIKEGLWEQMKRWKEDFKKVYKELYNPSDPNDPNSNTFLALIIKYAFISEDECTHANAIWTQAVLELIFDENYLSVKLDSDVVDMWYQKLLKEANDTNKKDACAFSANSQVGSLDLMDVDDLYKNLPNSDSESHLSDNSIEDNN
ncbi:5024_t:CDS:2, partial [Racocetra persica]